MTDSVLLPVSRISCPHCGATHPGDQQRCEKTGRAIGGDERLVGQLIDKRYRIVRVLGTGPFGAVYKAEHVTVGRHVALRILPSVFLQHPSALNRFFREARLMSSVAGPHIHALVDAGLSSEGLAYVAYEYVRGRSLAAALSVDAPLGLSQAATIVCDILSGLAALHESGFVHRLLSPESVLLQMSESGVEHAIVTNFGSTVVEAKIHRPASLGDALEAAALPTVFVPRAYEPPERERGAPTSRREDIFAAGVILAACLSPVGMVHFGSDLLRLGVPPTIDAIATRAANPHPEARFDTAKEMRDCLLAYAYVGEDDPSSVTETHIADLRALSRRERRGEHRLPAASGLVVQGVLPLAILLSLRARLGNLWGSVAAQVDGLGKLGPGPIPFVQLAKALEMGDVRYGTGDRLLCNVVGEAAAQSDAMVRLLAEQGPLTPELFFDQVATNWAKMLGYAKARAANVGRGYGRLELRGHPEPRLAVCACFTGILSATMARLGARNAEVNKTACEGVGDPACIYGATWM
jgi:serine/threonine-protein kinase